MVERPPPQGPASVATIESTTKMSGNSRRWRRFFCSCAEMPAEPFAYLLDRLVRFGHAPCAQDERVLALGHRVDLGANFEVGEPSTQLSAFAGEGLILAVVDAGGRQAGQIGVDEADLGVGELQGRVLQPISPEP